MSAGAKARRRRLTPARPKIKLAQHCEKWDKRSYRTKADALSVASRASRTGKQRAYRCPDCGHFHLTREQGMNDLPRWEQTVYVPPSRVAIGIAFNLVALVIVGLVIAGVLSPWWLL